MDELFVNSSNWDNLRYVLAVADHGSVSAAARVLGVTHATVLRRVAAFEAAQGGEVFDKSATGYQVRADRLRVIDAAREVENAIYSVDRLMHGARAPLRGVVRVSSTDTLCQIVLPPMIRHMSQVAPELQVEVLSSNHHVDVARLQADITIRPTKSLPDDMTGDVAAHLTFRAYGRPGCPDHWMALSGPLARSVAGVWMADHIPREQVSGSADSFLVLRELALCGLGVAILPAFVGDGVDGLAWRADLMPDLSVRVWVASHSDLSAVPRIRAARGHVLDYLAAQAPALAGN